MKVYQVELDLEREAELQKYYAEVFAESDDYHDMMEISEEEKK